MLGQDLLLETATDLVRRCRADETQVLIHAGDSQLTRFAENTIHQNVATESWTLQARVVKDKRIGVATGTLHDPAAAERIVERAGSMADNRRPLDEFVSLPGPAAGPESGLSEADLTSAADRAAKACTVISAARAAEAVASGAVAEGIDDVFVANSLGVEACFTTRRFETTTVVMAGNGSGYGFAIADKAEGLDIDKLAREATGTALDSRDPEELAPGA